MTTDNNMSAPLTADLQEELPRIALILAETFKTDANMLTHVAEDVSDYGTLLKLIQVPNQAANRNFNLTLECLGKFNDAGEVSGFVLTARDSADEIRLILDTSAENVIVNIQGLYLDSSDDTATRFDPEAFKAHCEVKPRATLYRSLLNAINRPSGNKSQRAYIHARSILDNAFSQQAQTREKLNAKVPMFKAFLKEAIDDYAEDDGRVKMLKGVLTDGNGHVTQDVVAVRFEGNGILFEIGPDYTKLCFAFGVVNTGEPDSWFDAGKLCYCARRAEDSAAYIDTAMRCLKAFSAFAGESPEVEAVRLRMLRMVCATPMPVEAERAVA